MCAGFFDRENESGQAQQISSIEAEEVKQNGQCLVLLNSAPYNSSGPGLLQFVVYYVWRVID